jgi:hypothetical protein
MEEEAARIAWWRSLADQYRIKAALALTAGSRFAFHVLAECADELAERIADGTITSREGPISTAAKKPDI